MIRKAVILAGGFGTRISEYTAELPKPMLTIGTKPILWHIMKYYHTFGVKEFIICGGYKIEEINKFFHNYHFSIEDYSYNFEEKQSIALTARAEDWRVHVINTGDNTMTGGRLKRISDYIDENEDFFMTYGDGLSDVDLELLYQHHTKNRKKVTVTAVSPVARFGSLEVNPKSGAVTSFREKPPGDGLTINGGFFILNKNALESVSCDQESWEEEPMQRLTKQGELTAYQHTGFWQPMDTKRDRDNLIEQWNNGDAKWKIWE